MLEAFAVFDVKAAAYGTPMFVANEGLALRGFSDACSQKESYLSQHPEDYTLMRIGTYDKVTGVLKTISPFVHIASAAAVCEMMRPSNPGLLTGLGAGDKKEVPQI